MPMMRPRLSSRASSAESAKARTGTTADRRPPSARAARAASRWSARWEKGGLATTASKLPDPLKRLWDLGGVVAGDGAGWKQALQDRRAGWRELVERQIRAADLGDGRD
jgi:hypothetical protein